MLCARVAFALFAASFAAACAQQSATGPAAEIRAIEQAIYAPYLDEDYDTGDVAIADAAPWSNATKARIAEADRLLNQDVFVFNPLTDSQEDILRDFSVGQPTVRADGTATVDVRFRMGGMRLQHHDYIREDGAWRLNNIRDEDWELDTLLRQAVAESQANAAREGP